MVAGREEETIEIERALARALPRLFFKRLLFSAEMWRSLMFRVTFSVSIFKLSRVPSVTNNRCRGCEQLAMLPARGFLFHTTTGDTR